MREGVQSAGGGSTGSDKKSQDGIEKGNEGNLHFKENVKGADGSSRNWRCDHGGWLEGVDHPRIYRTK